MSRCSAYLMLLVLIPGPSMQKANAGASERNAGAEGNGGAAFIYQGQLKLSDQPLNDTADFEFRLFDVPTGGSIIGPVNTVNNLSLVDGLFTVDLDFGQGVFDANDRWLEVSVRSPAGSGAFITLNPRQKLAPTPIAHFALGADGANINNLNAANITAGTLPDAALAGTFTGSVRFSNPSNTFTGRVDLVSNGVSLTSTSAPGSYSTFDFFKTGDLNASVRLGHSSFPQGAFTISTGDGASGAVERLVILPNGNVGIGTGNPLYALHVETSGPRAVYGIATSTTGVTYGGFFSSAAISGRGIHVEATHPTGENYGIWAQNASANGRALNGWATSPTGVTFGVNARSNSPDGRGVFGWASSTSGANYGGYFESSSINGRGVFGLASSTTGNSFAGYFRNHSSVGWGVYSECLATTGVNLAMQGIVNSPNAVAISGAAFATTGSATAVAGQTSSPDGYGVTGTAIANTGNSTGVYGSSASQNGRGVYGFAPGPSGAGVWGESNGTAGRAVYGLASGSGSAVGVEGVSHGQFAFGVYGEALGGVGRGVYGNASSLTGPTYGVYGTSSSTSGGGMFAIGAATSGTNYGIIAHTQSADGYAGYFTGAPGSANYFQRQVGIGTNDPQEMLHVVGNRIRCESPSIPGKSIELRSDGAHVSVDSNGGFNLFLTANGGAHVIMQEFGGSVGIGTNAPGGFKLAVSGSAAKTGGGSWSVFSDSRLKENIQPLPPGVLDRLLSIHGYSFEYRPEAIENRLALPGTQVGLIAQEVERVFPDWVEHDPDGYKFITERGTTALLIEALREMRAEKDHQIEQMQAEFQAQLDRKDLQITSLEQRIEALEKRVKQMHDANRD